MQSRGGTYDRATIVMHWSTASLVALLWIIGQTADWIPDGPINTGVWSVHVVAGFLLAVLLVSRIIWRMSGGRHLPDVDRGALRALAKATHYLLYGLLIAVVTLGVANAFVRAYHLFGLVTLPQIGDRELRKPITQWHGLAANILLGLAVFHASAALFHHFIWRDGVLRRMLPARPSGTQPE